MTTAEQAWQAMLEAEEAYVAARMALVAAGPDEVLRGQLDTVRGRGAALRVLADLLPPHTVNLFAEVFAVAVGSERDGHLAQHVLGRVDPAQAAEALSPLIEAFPTDQRDSWEYRRAAELLDALSQKELLARLVELAKRSDDNAIRRVGNDFSD